MPSSAVAMLPERPSRAVAACLTVGAVLLVAAATFPAYELVTFHPTVGYEEPPENGDDDRFGQAYEFEELDPESQALVERIIEERGDVIIYAPRGAQYHADGELPPVFADTWLDSHTLGAYVHYEGQWYRIASSVPGEPLHYPLVIGFGILSGLGVLAGGLLAREDGQDWLAVTGAGGGLLVLLWLLRMANVSGYVWPVQ